MQKINIVDANDLHSYRIENLNKCEHTYHCFLCFRNIEREESRRVEKSGMRKFIKEECQPTPFVWEWLQNIDMPCSLCLSCFNWQRRCVRKHSRKNKRESFSKSSRLLKQPLKPFLQLDQMIMFFMMPGRYTMPDHRSFPRLIQTMCDPMNPVHAMIPINVRHIIMQVQEFSSEGGVKAWWDFNNRTHFMQSPSTAKMVRYLLKKEEEMDRMEEDFECED